MNLLAAYSPATLAVAATNQLVFVALNGNASVAVFLTPLLQYGNDADSRMDLPPFRWNEVK